MFHEFMESIRDRHGALEIISACKLKKKEFRGHARYTLVTHRFVIVEREERF